MILRPSFISGARRPHLSRFYVERIQKARLYTNRTFQRLATWGLGPKPSIEDLAHEITTRKREFFFSLFFYLFINIFIFEIDVFPFMNDDDEREQRQGGCGQGS